MFPLSGHPHGFFLYRLKKLKYALLIAFEHHVHQSALCHPFLKNSFLFLHLADVY